MFKKISIGIISSFLILSGILSFFHSEKLDPKQKKHLEFSYNSPEPMDAKLVYIMGGVLVLTGLFGFSLLETKKEA